MNRITPYEQLMAAKLDQVPVPDMSDSVWASIEMQLEVGVDAPDKASGKKPSQGYRGWSKGWYGFLGAVVVVATLWWYVNHIRQSAKSAAPATKPSVIKEPSSVTDSNTATHDIKKKNTRTAPVPVKTDTLLLHSIPGNGTGPDSAVKQELPPVGIDSSLLHVNKTPVPSPDSVSRKPPGRKPRGVKGITEDDYKISAEKHSDKKKN